MTPRVSFEIRHLIAAPFTLLMLAQFIPLMWVEHRIPKPVFYVIGLPFVLQDVIYNIVIGSFIFWERPQEWLFTDRLKRMANDRPGPAARFAAVLNFFDEGHV